MSENKELSVSNSVDTNEPTENLERINEQEKEIIEKKIVEAMQKTHENIEQEKTLEEERIEKVKKIEHEALRKNKNQLIEEFIQLQKTQNEHLLYTADELKRLKKADIIKKLAEYVNDIFIGKNAANVQQTQLNQSDQQSSQINSTNPENSNANVNVSEKPIPNSDLANIVNAPTKQPDINHLQFDLIATGIYNMNLALMSCLETGSHLIKNKTADIAVLDNLTRTVEAKKEAFIFVFKQIYRDYKQELDVYLTPMAQYGILTMQVITETVFKNVAEKKKKSQADTKK